MVIIIVVKNRPPHVKNPGYAPACPDQSQWACW